MLVQDAEFVLQHDLSGAEDFRVTGFKDAMSSNQSEPADRLRDYISSKHTHDGGLHAPNHCCYSLLQIIAYV